MQSCVPFQETIVSISCTAQPLVTLPTEPSGGDAAMMDVSVQSTVTPWMPRPVTLQPDGVWKGADDGSTTTSTSATTVIPDQILCQLESKRLEVLEGTRA